MASSGVDLSKRVRALGSGGAHTDFEELLPVELSS